MADTADPEALGAAVALAEERFGGLDAMVAVAGVIAGGVPLWEMPADELAAVLEVDLGGPITAARVGIPALLRRPAPRQGRFLAVASAAATRGLLHLAAYGAAKAGVAGLVRGLAADLADSGITANAVSPGSTDTAILVESARLYGLDGTGPFADQQPVKRLLTPEEVASALVWLAGPDSGGLTGAVIPVDGGLSL
jgi:SDR family mycofactocin-dependent oxidoreductase